VCHQRFYRSVNWLKSEASPVRSKPVVDSALPEIQPAPAAGIGIGRPVAKWAGIILAFSLAAYGVYYFWPSHSGTGDSEKAMSLFVIEEGINRFGGDYFSFGVREPSPEACAVECAKNSNCRAFTLVKPLVPGAAAVCWLKTTAMTAIPDPCCISGIRTQ
jgi:hypothetical protein